MEKAVETLLDQEGGDAARPFPGLGIDDQRVGISRVGDPIFGAIEDIAVAPFVGAQRHRDDVRSGARFDMVSDPTWSPEMSLGRERAFCSAVAKRRTWLTQRLECAP